MLSLYLQQIATFCNVMQRFATFLTFSFEIKHVIFTMDKANGITKRSLPPSPFSFAKENRDNMRASTHDCIVVVSSALFFYPKQATVNKKNLIERTRAYGS